MSQPPTVSANTRATAPLVVLLGLRGSGKSTVGPIVAAALGRDFVDLDPLTAGELGHATPAAALTALGEPAFRAGECRALASVLAQRPGCVLALGGGTPTHAPSRELLERAAKPGPRAPAPAMLVYLHAPPAELSSRLAGTDTSTRPALLPGGGGVVAEVAELYARRDGLYRRLASAVVESAGRDAGEVAAEIVTTVAQADRGL